MNSSFKSDIYRFGANLVSKIWSKHFLCTFSCHAVEYVDQKGDKILCCFKARFRFGHGCVYSGIPVGLDGPGRPWGQPAQNLWTWDTHDASQERNHLQGGECQADKLQPVMKPEPSHGKDNSEHSMMLPFGYVPLGTQVWILGGEGLQAEIERAIFTKAFWDAEDSDDLNIPKPQLLPVPFWLKQQLLFCLLRLIWSCI